MGMRARMQAQYNMSAMSSDEAAAKAAEAKNRLVLFDRTAVRRRRCRSNTPG